MAVQKIWDGSTWVQVGISPSEHEGDISSVSSQLAHHLNDDENPHLFAKRLISSITDKTYYIDAVNGNDANDGLTSATAFKTWDKMTEVFPYFLVNNYTINIIRKNKR